MRKSEIIYITGTPGSGKTTVGGELKTRGYNTFDTDNDGIAHFYDTTTGEKITEPVSSEERTPYWRSRHKWIAKRDMVEELQYTADGEPVFLCGVTSNDVEELWDIFSKVFALVVEDETILTRRVIERDEDGYGKNQHELDALLEWQRTAIDDYRNLGAIVVDGSKPVDKVADYILERVLSGK